MSNHAEKLLVVESDEALREAIASVLRDADYEVSTDFQRGMKVVLDFKPDIVILGRRSAQARLLRSTRRNQGF